MTTLPNPWISFAEVEPSSANSAAASSPLSPNSDAAAGQFESPMTMEVIEEAPAVVEPITAGATDHIHEIFHFARKLFAEDHRFVLDEAAFMEAIEPPPLFLQDIA